MSKIVLKNGSTITFTGDGDKLTGCQPDWVMEHLIEEDEFYLCVKSECIPLDGEMVQKLIQDLNPEGHE